MVSPMELQCIIFLACALLAQGQVTIIGSWPGGYEAMINFNSPKDVNGWDCVLTFDIAPDVFETWDSDIQSGSGTTYTLVNKPSNGVIGNGQALETKFLVRFSGAQPNLVRIVFAGVVIMGGEQTPVPTVTTNKPGESTPVPPTNGPCTDCDKYDYNELIQKSILFYEAERSGWLPGNNRVPWRGNSATEDSDSGVALDGGWYDAGDHVKFGFPMAWSVTALAWGMIEFKEGYVSTGEYDNALDSIKWPLDYFIKAHPSSNAFYGQCGNGHDDHAFWGRPEDMSMYRPCWKITASSPGSDLAGETAAAMAAGSMIFRSAGDAGYADTLLSHARQLYDFAYNHRGVYSDSITNAADFYKSWSGYEDELAWGALWLYRATGEEQYLTKAEEFMSQGMPKFFSWDDKNVGNQLLHVMISGKDAYRGAVENFLRNWFPGGAIPYTPKGLAWGDQWGPNRYAANSALIALIAAKNGILADQGQAFAIQQIHYMLGDGGRSFVCGFGNNPPTRPHHRAASCPNRPAPCGDNELNNPGPSHQVLNGALVGGPGQWDDYEDDRHDYIKNEVACDYNAGFQGAVAGLKQLTL